MCLNDLCIDDMGIIKVINCNGVIRRRLMDIGFLPGSLVSCVLSSPSGNPRAYLIKGSLIALRNEDAGGVEVDLVCE